MGMSKSFLWTRKLRRAGWIQPIKCLNNCQVESWPIFLKVKKTVSISSAALGQEAAFPAWFLPGALETKVPVYKLSSPYSWALFEDMYISSTFLKHHLGVFRGHRKPVLFVGFFSSWAVFALQLVYLWQIATCSWQQTFTLSSAGVSTLCFAHLWWGN